MHRKAARHMIAELAGAMWGPGPARLRDVRSTIARVTRWLATLATTTIVLASTALIARRLSASSLERWSLRQQGVPPISPGVLQYGGTLLLLYLLVHLPWLVAGGRRALSYTRGEMSDDESEGPLALIVGAVTRLRDRLIVSIAAAVATLILAIVAVIVDLRAPGPPSSSVIVWGLAAMAFIYGSRRLLDIIALPYLPGRYQYPVRSRRIGLAVGQGVRSGLVIGTWVILFIPVVTLNCYFFAVIPGSARWLPQSGALGWIFSQIMNATLAIAISPGTTAILLAALPLAVIVVVYRLAGRLVPADGDEWALPPDIPAALYLRSWDADRIKIRARGVRQGVVDGIAPPRKVSFAELVGRGAQLIAPVLATAEPGGRRLEGMGSMWSTTAEWRANVTAKARTALCVVMTAGQIVPGSGYAWELELIGDGQMTRRLVLILPPGLPLSLALQDGQFLDLARSLPAFDGLETDDLSDDTLVLARSTATPWIGFASAIQNDLGYYLCILNAMDRFRDEWESEARAADTLPSEDRFVRDAASEDGGMLARAALRIGHRILRSNIGRRYLGWIEKKFKD